MRKVSHTCATTAMVPRYSFCAGTEGSRAGLISPLRIPRLLRDLPGVKPHQRVAHLNHRNCQRIRSRTISPIEKIPLRYLKCILMLRRTPKAELATARYPSKRRMETERPKIAYHFSPINI